MEQIIKYLYSKFLFRDMLGYTIPGLLLLTIILFVFNLHKQTFKEIKDSKILVVGVIFLSYTIGLIIQALATYSYENGHHYPFTSFYPNNISSESLKFARQDFEFNSIVVSIRSNEVENDTLERFSVLRMIHGNVSFALLLSIMFLFLYWFYKFLRSKKNKSYSGNPKDFIIEVIKKIALLIILYFFHLILWRENQKLFIKEEIWRELIYIKHCKHDKFIFKNSYFTPLLIQLQKDSLTKSEINRIIDLVEYGDSITNSKQVK
jgi:hypothetical protein